MVMVVLDSNIIIYLSKGLLKIEDVLKDDAMYATSVITYMEVMGYEFTSSKEKAFIEKLFSYLEILYIDENIVKKTIALRIDNKIKLPDAIICATAIASNATLFTNDTRLKSIKNLKVKHY